MSLKITCFILPFAVLFLAMPNQALGTEKTLANEPVTHVVVAPYLWTTGVKGNISLQNADAQLDLSTGELLSNVNAGGMGFIRAQKGDKFIFAESLYIDYDDPSARDFFSLPVRSNLKFIEAGVGKDHILHLGQHPITISPYLGLQYTKIRVRVNGADLNLSSNDEWGTLGVGVFIDTPITKRWRSKSKLDISGIGITDNKAISAISALEYRANKKLTWVIGYRWVDADYESDNSLNLDLRGHGPLIGLSYKTH